MGWFRQFFALMNKNWIIKRRLWFSSCSEILLPVLIMFVMVGIRAAISKSNNDASLRIDQGYAPGNPMDKARISLNVFDQSAGAARKIAWIPGNDPFVQAAAAQFGVVYPQLKNISILTFNSDADLTEYCRSTDYGLSESQPYLYGAVVFNKIGTVTRDWDYTVRLNYSGNPTRDTFIDTSSEGALVNVLQWKYDTEWDSILLKKGAYLLQDFVEQYIIEQTSQATPIKMIRYQGLYPMPTPPYIYDDFAGVISAFLGLFFTIVYIWPVTRLVKGLVEEKETRIKEGMKMMGLSDSALFFSWLITYIIMFFLTAVLITIITAGSVYEYSDKGLIFFFFFFFGLSIFGFCYFIQVFFSRARVASTFSALVFLVSFFPYYAVEGDGYSTGAKAAACLSAPICFGLGAVTIAELESSSTGVKANNAGTMVKNWSYNNTIGFFILDFFIYIFLGWYLDKVFPTEWGTRQPLWFPFLPSYWCPKRITPNDQRANAGEQDSLNVRHIELKEKNPASHDNPNMEPVSDSLRDHIAVSLKGLRKVFPGPDGLEDFVAVKGMNLDLYTGQILSLLGHNGAGKTTLINMLSGMLPPSEGDAEVYGNSLVHNMKGVRHLLGVCPQHNILFDLLTVKEHLELFCAIKGVERSKVKEQVDTMIAEVGLTEKVNDKSAALSGGMQRKLSIAIALIGDSKIIFLDEPTSGMDPYSRRFVWDMLKRYIRGERKTNPNNEPVNPKDLPVIILTTHFMDEADHLGDRIAIMAKGEMKCCGSSLFLKQRYGVGYSLTIVKENANLFKEGEVSRLVYQMVPDASELSNIAGEISFRLPFAHSANFPELFESFDKNLHEYGINSYGISVTTLEEVFLRVGHDEEVEPQKQAENRVAIQEVQRKMSFSQNRNGQQADGGELVVVVDESKNNGNGTSVVVPSSASSISHKSDIAPDGHHLTEEEKKFQLDHERFSKIRVGAIEGRGVFFMHFNALFFKRWINAKRDKKVWTWTILYPFLILFAGIKLVTLQTFSFPLRPVDTTPYNVPDIVVYNPAYTDNVFGIPASSTFDWTVSPFAASNTREQFQLNIGLKNATQMNQYLYDTYPSMKLSRWGSYLTGTQFIRGSGSVTVPAAVLNGSSIVNYGQSPPVDLYKIVTGTTTVAGDILIDNPIIFFNASAKLSAHVFTNLYNQYLYANLSGNGNARIKMNVHPLPQTLNQETLRASLVALIIAIGFAFMPANFISFAVKEDSDKVKHQQLISGVTAPAYWIANYCWDFLNYLIMAVLCLVVLAIWDVKPLIGSNSGATIVALILYGLSIIPFTYLTSFLFKSHTGAQNTMLLFFIITGAAFLVALIILRIISSTKRIAEILSWIVRLLPSYSFAESIAFIMIRSSPTAFGRPAGLWDMEVCGWAFVYMTIESVVYFLLVLLVEKIKSTPQLSSRLFGNDDVHVTPEPDTDPDVIEEKRKLQDNPHPQDSVVNILGLRKVYGGRLGLPPKIAVSDLWLSIPAETCLGLLGINGAGKTTTFKMLTGDIIPTSGTANLYGFDILSQQGDVRRHLGYCPQFDALPENLTGREILNLFARIKLVPADVIPDYIEYLVQKLGLQKGIADRPAKGYSGGNKRKLCVGMALIGNPPVVFLDEPSTGMDPGSRRYMWDVISSTMAGRCVILTTHSMEECEALCHRIGIMVGGRFRCLGTTQRLKHLYGDAFQLDCNVPSGVNQSNFTAWVKETWPTSQIIELHGDSIKFRIPREWNGFRTTIATLFKLLEQHKQQFSVKEYSVSETSLEQIFIAMAKTQKEERGHAAGVM